MLGENARNVSPIQIPPNVLTVEFKPFDNGKLSEVKCAKFPFGNICVRNCNGSTQRNSIDGNRSEILWRMLAFEDAF